MESYALLKCGLCYSADGDTIFYPYFKKSRRCSLIYALDPALHASLKSAQ